MSDCCLIKKVATVEVYENKNEVRAYGFMSGDRNTPVMEVKFKHLFGEESLSECKLRWIIVDDLGSLLVGEVPIKQDNTASINLPNELFIGERRMKVQLTVASCDGKKILNLQQFTDLKVINNLATNEVVEPVYQMLINQVYDDTKKYLAELETSYKAKYGSLESVYAKSKASLEQYLITAENGGNAEFLQGYSPVNFIRSENTINELVNSATGKYKVGDIVDLNGYYTTGDGAHHKRKIESADDGSGVQLANGLWANIVHNGEINVSWFGAKSGVDADYTVNTTAFKKAISKCPNIFVPSGTFHINDTLVLSQKRLTGTSRTSSFIKMMANKHLLDVGWRCCVEHLGLSFDSTVVEASKTGECSAILSTSDTSKYMHFSTLNDVQIGTCGYGILGVGFFSNTVRDLEIRDYKHCGIELTANSRTQNVWENLYLTTTHKVQSAIKFLGEETGSTVNGLNIEHTTFTSDAVVMQRFNATISNIHYEGAVLTNKNTSLLKSVNSKLKIGKFEIYYCFFDTDTSSTWDYIGVYVKDHDNAESYFMPSNIIIDSYAVMGLNYQYQSGRLLGLTDPNLRFVFVSAQADLTTSAFVKITHYSYKTWIDDTVKLKAFYHNPHNTLTTRLEFKKRYLDIPFKGLWGSSSHGGVLRVFNNRYLRDEPGVAHISQPIDRFNTSYAVMAEIPSELSGFAITRTLRENCTTDNYYDFRVYNLQLRLYTNYLNDTGELVPNHARVFPSFSWVFQQPKPIEASLLKAELLYEEHTSYQLEYSYWVALEEVRREELIERYKKRENKDETYEKWFSLQPAVLSTTEPRPSEKLKAFYVKHSL